MKVYIGADHAGFALKERLKPLIEDAGFEIEDVGANEYNDQDDYPDFVIPVARAVSSNPEQSRGIVIGGSGQGEAICANRFKHVRAAVWYGPGNRIASDTKTIIELSREDNDANILSIGARFVTDEEATTAVETWLATAFSGAERHKRRINKIDQSL